VPLDLVVSYFVFSLVCRRYEKGPMIWTSNKGFAEWASVFAGDEVLTAAILDRLLSRHGDQHQG
jgi:DNA replication protein DnaC